MNPVEISPKGFKKDNIYNGLDLVRNIGSLVKVEIRISRAAVKQEFELFDDTRFLFPAIGQGLP